MGDAVFGRYRLERRLGTGGFGDVWAARDPELNRRVALKLLKRAGPEDLARFRREAETTARLDHPGIARIYEFGEADGQAYLALEYVDGTTLAKWRGDGREAARLVRDAAAAVQHAHDNGVLHRDLKPENIMLDAAGRVRVMDFGLARVVAVESSLSQSGFAVGTPAYMPPEQARGERHATDARSDVWALGATLYALVSGRPPFDGASTFDILLQVIDAEPPSPDTGHAELDAIILKCLEKEKGRRYATAADLAADLDRWLAGGPVSARRSGRVARALGRRKWRILGAVAALVIVAAGVVLLRRTTTSAESAKDAMLRRMRETAKTCFDAAMSSRRVGNFEAMEAHAERLKTVCADVRAAEPGLAEPHVLLGQMYSKQLKDAEAEAEYRSALAKEPADEEARYRLGILLGMALGRRRADLMRMGRGVVENEETLRQRDEALELLSARDNALSRSLREMLRGGKPTEVRGLVAAFRDEEVAWTLEIQLVKEDEAALAMADEALRWDAGFMDVRDVRGRLLFAREGASEEVLAQAVADVEMASKLAPRLPRAWSSLAMALNAAAQRHREGAPLFRRALEAAERARELGAPMAWSRIALIRVDWANYEAWRGREAKALYEQAIEAASQAVAVPESAAQGLIIRAESRFALTGVDAADRTAAALKGIVEDAQRAVSLGWTGANAHQLAGQAESRLGRVLALRGEPGSGAAFERAETALTRAIELEPRRADLFADRGSLYVALGNGADSAGKDGTPWFEKAEQDLETGRKLDPRNSPVRANLVGLYMTWGVHEARRGRDSRALLEKAVGEADALLELDGTSKAARRGRMESLLNLGILHIQRRQNPTACFEKSMADATVLVGAPEATVGDWLNRGRLQSEWGIYCAITKADAGPKFDGALKDLEKAASMSPKDADVLVQIGAVHVNYAIHRDRSGGDAAAQFQKAADALDRAIAAAPQHALAWHYRGNVDYSYADYLRRRGKPAAEACRAALKSFQRSVELDASMKASIAPKMKFCRQYLDEHPDE